MLKTMKVCKTMRDVVHHSPCDDSHCLSQQVREQFSPTADILLPASPPLSVSPPRGTNRPLINTIKYPSMPMKPSSCEYERERRALVLFCLPSILLSSQLRCVSAVPASGRLAFMGHGVSFVQRNLALAIKEKKKDCLSFVICWQV